MQQGSKTARAYIPKGGGKPRANVVEQAGVKLKAWRSLALETIREAGVVPDVGALFDRGRPVALRVRFVFPLRVEDQAAIRRWEKRADQLDWRHTCEPGCVHAPWHTVTPDKDKLTRALFDVLKLARVWHDDAQCCRFEVIAYRTANPCTIVEWVPLDTQH